MSGTMYNVAQDAAKIVDSQITLGDTSAHPLAGLAGCKRIKLIAPVNSAGAAQNTAPIFFGDSTNQRDWIAADGSRDTYVHVDDPAKISVKGASGDKLNYRVEY